MQTTRERDGARIGDLTEEHIWRSVSKASFAVLGYVTPSGEPRASGVVYKTLGHRLYVAVATDSWKARHIALSHEVSVTVPVRRGGLLSLVAPIPPATVSFHGTAVVHAPGEAALEPVLDMLGALLPPERRGTATILEVFPEGAFVTYGIGVSLAKMRDTAAARARVPITPSAGFPTGGGSAPS
jgi:hypothetical protein